jgi:hypothetical protein
LFAGWIAGASASVSVHGHALLDPEVAQKMLVEIAQAHRGARSAPTQDARAEALYALGVRVQALVELLDQDAMAHDGAGPLGQLIVKRLEDYDVQVLYSEQSRRFLYDQAAMRQYLQLMPRGARAADARFQILAAGFHATLPAGPPVVTSQDRGAVSRAVIEEERFLRDYPKHPKAREVLFFLGVDCYRLWRNEADKGAQYERCARRALQRLIEEDPQSIEARAASALRETMDGAPLK